MKSIGDFAESLILGEVKNIQEGKSLPSSTPTRKAPAGKDIRDISVPDTMMKEILGESYTPEETVDSIPEIVWTDPTPPEEEVAPPTPTMITESTAQELIPLLNEVKNLLSELTAAATTTGSIGVNLGGPTKSWAKIEKDYGYRSSLKPTLGNNQLSRKKVLKQSIRNRLRRSK
jgi:hypothetical protein